MFQIHLQLTRVPGVPAAAGAGEPADAVGAGAPVGAGGGHALVVLQLALVSSIP